MKRLALEVILLCLTMAALVTVGLHFSAHSLLLAKARAIWWERFAVPPKPQLLTIPRAKVRIDLLGTFMGTSDSGDTPDEGLALLRFRDSSLGSGQHVYAEGDKVGRGRFTITKIHTGSVVLSDGSTEGRLDFAQPSGQ